MKVKIELLRSQSFPKVLALAINDYRVAGPKAGPWTVVETLHADVEDIREALRQTPVETPDLKSTEPLPRISMRDLVEGGGK